MAGAGRMEGVGMAGGGGRLEGISRGINYLEHSDIQMEEKERDR
jgi:hypothetical protein